ncbi:hypothetical protein SASPL_117147 [Salvia splendens]|uniref:Single-stranded DNA binding protein Ssb-like OB fold domain-containing protein n=1 Tax=Salvia splendens TaxID=180675 RepID=A0A8X8ZXC2_SALSN|nr:hypothetical protein SASPL_117147 [Salvia splendens]
MAAKAPSSEAQQQGGGSAGTKPGLRQPVFVKVDSLMPGTTGHTLVVKVLESTTVLSKKPRNPTFRGAQNQNTRIAECLIGDETGTILFTARNDQVADAACGSLLTHLCLFWYAVLIARAYELELGLVEMMKPGNTVILRNAKIDMFKGSMRLAVDKWGRVEVTEPAEFVVKEENNLSLVEYELVNVEES